MIVDFDGRILAQAESGSGEKIVVGPIDLSALQAERERRQGHQMLAHLRQEVYPGYLHSIYPPSTADQKPPSVAGNQHHIQKGRQSLKAYQDGLHDDSGFSNT